MLLKLIPAEDDEFPGVLLLQHDFGEFLAKGTSATGNKDSQAVPILHQSISLHRSVAVHVRFYEAPAKPKSSPLPFIQISTLPKASPQ